MPILTATRALRASQERLVEMESMCYVPSWPWSGVGAQASPSLGLKFWPPFGQAQFHYIFLNELMFHLNFAIHCEQRSVSASVGAQMYTSSSNVLSISLECT